MLGSILFLAIGLTLLFFFVKEMYAEEKEILFLCISGVFGLLLTLLSINSMYEIFGLHVRFIDTLRVQYGQTILGISVLFVIGAVVVSMFLKWWYVHIIMKRRCTKKIEVACNFVKVHTSQDSENVPTKMYSPIWKDADGYQYECETYSTRKYFMGDEETILVNPNNRKEYVDSLKLRISNLDLLFGTIFFGMILLILYV